MIPSVMRESITFVVSSLYPQNGLERATLRLASALSASYNVRLCVIGDAQRLNIGSMNVEILGGELHKLERVFSVYRLRMWIKEQAPTVIIASGIWAAVPLLSLPSIKAHRIIVWEHSLDIDKVRSSWGLRFLEIAARVFYKRSFAIVAVSESLRKQLEVRLSFKNVIAIPNIIEIRIEQENSQSRRDSYGTYNLLCVGRLTSVKNQALALESLALLPSTYFLTLAGDGEDRDALMALAHKLGIASRVTFTGHIADLSPIYRSSHAVVLPSLGETFGLAMMEAAEYMLPVIALNRSVMRQNIPYYVPGILTDATPQAFSSAIAAAVASPIPEEQYERCASRRNRDFSEESVTKHWKSLISRAQSKM